MIDHLYRFRPLSRVLGGELLNQHIYFAKPENLNDPMEGFRDIFWRGDAIVWRNLFRHYLLCLERALSLLAILGEEQPIGWGMIPVFNLGDTSFTPQQKAKQDEIINAFFAEECIKSYVDALATRTQPVRRAELAAHLRSIHPLAAVIVQECYERHGLLKPKAKRDPALMDKLRETIAHAKTAIDQIRRIEEEGGAQTEFQIDMFFSAQLKTLQELNLIHLYSGTANPKEKNRNFVFLNFSDEYVQKVETLVYPDWYTTCFMEECRDSSVWGSYGQNHEAACLKFKVKDAGGTPALSLYRISAIGSGGPAYGFLDHPFYQIVYENEHLPVDFYASLGRLPIPVLRQYWYADQEGNLSPIADEIFKNEEVWRTKYWDAFYHAITRKLKAWYYEREHRLVLSGTFFDFTSDESRTLKYDFKDLEGIIFGIKTPSDAKLEIFKILEDKCRSTGRTDFKFYQAFYARATGTIEHAELNLLKFKF
jgi:hypothetical protein